MGRREGTWSWRRTERSCRGELPHVSNLFLDSWMVRNQRKDEPSLP